MTQLGFDSLLTSAAEENRNREFARETAHLPSTMPEGLAHYRLLIRQHHAAMLAADGEKVMALRREAKFLARKLNGGDTGILADEDSAGNVLTRETEPRRDCRRLQLLSRMEHHEQDDEQVFP
ncbi:hypothetical protein [Chelativorans sp. J32]|uniref:hypothetical protein n=1 Tax=Chelativorans sp. J32 TaxID=935840 RepID=UPI00048829AC|nr:hypothetical protein [Chelativorans sp. J32]